MQKKNLLYFGMTILLMILAIVFYFKTNTYQVNFYQDGILINTIEVRKNRPFKEPEIPQKENLMFLGWYENNELWNFENKVTHNMNLVARYATISSEKSEE